MAPRVPAAMTQRELATPPRRAHWPGSWEAGDPRRGPPGLRSAPAAGWSCACCPPVACPSVACPPVACPCVAWTGRAGPWQAAQDSSAGPGVTAGQTSAWAWPALLAPEPRRPATRDTAQPPCARGSVGGRRLGVGRLCGGISPASPPKSPQQRRPTHPGAPAPHPRPPAAEPETSSEAPGEVRVSKGRGKGCVGAGRHCLTWAHLQLPGLRPPPTHRPRSHVTRALPAHPGGVPPAA